MKEMTNYTLLIYESTIGRIEVDKFQSNWTKFFISVLMFPCVFAIVFIALCIEEPFKCICSVCLFQTTPRKAWNHYKRCWLELLGGMRST